MDATCIVTVQAVVESEHIIRENFHIQVNKVATMCNFRHGSAPHIFHDLFQLNSCLQGGCVDKLLLNGREDVWMPARRWKLDQLLPAWNEHGKQRMAPFQLNKTKKFCTQASDDLILGSPRPTCTSKGMTVISASYCNLLQNYLRPAIRSKHHGLSSTGAVSLYNNARLHTVCVPAETIRDIHFECLSYPWASHRGSWWKDSPNQWGSARGNEWVAMHAHNRDNSEKWQNCTEPICTILAGKNILRFSFNPPLYVVTCTSQSILLDMITLIMSGEWY